jgi:hypothetical protein
MTALGFTIDPTRSVIGIENVLPAGLEAGASSERLTVSSPRR